MFYENHEFEDVRRKLRIARCPTKITNCKMSSENYELQDVQRRLGTLKMSSEDYELQDNSRMFYENYEFKMSSKNYELARCAAKITNSQDALRKLRTSRCSTRITNSQDVLCQLKRELRTPKMFYAH